MTDASTCNAQKRLTRLQFTSGTANALLIAAGLDTQKECVMSSMTSINEFLSAPALALIGMSRSGKKFGNFAYRALVSKGYRVYPIHPYATAIKGIKCYPDYAALPEPVEDVLVVVPPPQAIAAVRSAAVSGVRRVWLQQGSESAEVLKACRDLGLSVISGECILMFARPAGVHKAHRWVWGLLGKLPA
jgi:predicted CoA-binding protein